MRKASARPNQDESRRRELWHCGAGSPHSLSQGQGQRACGDAVSRAALLWALVLSWGDSACRGHLAVSAMVSVVTAGAVLLASSM